MNTTAKLLIPIGLALAAFAGNWIVMQPALEMVGYTGISKPVKVGEKITREHLTTISLPKAYDEGLRKTAVPATQWALLLERTATRDLAPNSLVLWQDVDVRGPELNLAKNQVAFPVSLDRAEYVPGLLRIGGTVYLRFLDVERQQALPGGLESAALLEAAAGPQQRDIGPFTVVTIGSRFTNDASALEDSSAVRVISVAFPKPPAVPAGDDKLLVEMCDLQAQGKVNLVRVLHVPDAPSAAASSAPSR